VKGAGVISWKGGLAYYEPGEEGPRVHLVGESQPLEVCPELRVAIEVDRRHQREKAEAE